MMAFAIPIIVMLFILAFVMNSGIVLGMAIGFLAGSVFICYMFRYIIKTGRWTKFIEKAMQEDKKE